MNEATSRMDLNMFAKKVDLSATQTIQQIQELAKAGFLQKVGGGYGITARGKAAIRAFTPVPEGMGFHFYNGVDQPTELTAQTLVAFYGIIKKVSSDSLEFHLYRNDFEIWLKEACGDPELAAEIDCVRSAGLLGEALRTQLLKALDISYGIQELL